MYSVELSFANRDSLRFYLLTRQVTFVAFTN
jgi:hypothetical protein